MSNTHKINTFIAAAALAAVISFSGCTPSDQKADESAPEETTTQGIADMAHNSMNSLDWAGVYKGTIPCADCPGIETRIVLKEDGTFDRSVRYLERDENPRYDKGTFTWDDGGSIVTLTAEDGSVQMYKVGENVLFHLDSDGNMITGDLADQYRLPKNLADYRIESNKWVLVEIMGQPVDTAALMKPAFIQFDPKTARFSGSGGCNNYFGTYELMKGDRIRFGQAGSTMMACPDMTVEQQLMKVLETADNYNVNDSMFVLNRARMAPLARFAVSRD